MDLQMLFEVREGVAVPKLPSDSAGNPRVADGRELLTIQQAAEKTGQSTLQLKQLWEFTWADLIPMTAGTFISDAETLCASGDDVQSTSAPKDEEVAPTSAVLCAVAALPQEDLYHQAVRRVICGHLSEEQFHDFMAICRARKLDPLKRQIYPRTRFDEDVKKLEVIGVTTIDGFRAVASRNPRYSGQSGPQWCGSDGQWVDVWPDRELYPVAARVGIYLGTRGEPTWATAHWDEFAPFEIAKGGEIIYDEFWKKMPTHMLAKVAEALALRRALPEELSGLYTADEIGTMRQNRPRATIGERRDRGEPVYSDSLPATVYSLKLALINDLGLNALDADYRISRHKERYAQLAAENEAAFCAAVFSSIKRTESRKLNPQPA